MTDPESVAAEATAADLFGENFTTAKLYVDLLSSRGIDWGLIGPREAPRLWQRHIFNSVAPASLIPVGASLIDLGSGAGLPGIPLALHREDLSVTLLEPLKRRAEFLTGVVDELGLGDRVRVVRGRAEEHRERYQVVASRAVAALTRLVGWSAPLIRPGGCMLAIKGESAEREIVEARATLRRHRLAAEVVICRAHATAEATFVVRATKE